MRPTESLFSVLLVIVTSVASVAFAADAPDADREKDGVAAPATTASKDRVTGTISTAAPATT